MAARQDNDKLRQLLQGDSELLKLSGDYLARLRNLAYGNAVLRENATALAPIAALLACEENGSDDVTVASAQKASFRRPGEFQNCLRAVRSLLTRKSTSVSPQKTVSRSVTFDTLAAGYFTLGIGKAVVQEMDRAMQEWERLMDKAKSGKHTSVDDPRYTKAIFVWVLVSLKYPMDKAAFCQQQSMRQVDLTNVLQSLDTRCFARKAALEKKTDLLYQGSSEDQEDPVPSPTRSLKRKASNIADLAETTPTKRPYTPSLLSGRRDSQHSSPLKPDQSADDDSSPTKRMTRSATGAIITPIKPFAYKPGLLSSAPSQNQPASAKSSRSNTSSNPFTPSPTKLRARPMSPSPAPASPASSAEDDDRYSPPPPPKYRLRPLFLETLGLSKMDNMREVEWFRSWRDEISKRQWESETEDEIEEFEDSEEGTEEESEKDGGGHGAVKDNNESEDGGNGEEDVPMDDRF